MANVLNSKGAKHWDRNETGFMVSCLDGHLHRRFSLTT